MQKPSAFSSILHRIWLWRNRDPIENLDKAVNEADIDDVIDILKRYNNEKVIRVALCKSVIADNISLVHAILQHTKIANVSDNFFKKRKYKCSDSPLIIACQYGNPEIVSLLCGSGFLINVVDQCNRTPLLAAVTIDLLSQPDIHGALDVIQNQKTVHMKGIVSLLIEKGADINITDSKYGRTPLHQVCFDGTLEAVRHLRDNGANINAKDSDGKTPLFYCLRTLRIGNFWIGRVDVQSYLNNHEEGNKIMKYLVESGADINCRDTKDQSVLDYAYKTCRPFATFLLFKYGGIIRRSCHVTIQLHDWYCLINKNLGNANFWRHLVRHTSVCRRIYLDAIGDLNIWIGCIESLEPFFSITSETEIPLSLKDQCRSCIRNAISRYTESGLQFEKCINTLCMPKTLKSFLMFEELEQFVSVRDDLLNNFEYSELLFSFE